VLVIDRLHRRIGEHPAVVGFIRGLSLAVVGVFLVVLARLLGSAGVDPVSLAIVGLSVGLGRLQRIPVVLVMVLGVVLGILLR